MCNIVFFPCRSLIYTFRYVYLNFDPVNDWRLRESAQNNTGEILEVIKAHIDKIDSWVSFSPSELSSASHICHRSLSATRKTIWVRANSTAMLSSRSCGNPPAKLQAPIGNLLRRYLQLSFQPLRCTLRQSLLSSISISVQTSRLRVKRL